MEAEGLCTAEVEVVCHIDDSTQENQQQDYAHTCTRLVGHMHLLNQSDESMNTTALLQDNLCQGDRTHWGRRRGGLKRALQSMNEAIGRQDVGVGDKAVVDIPG